MRRVLLASVAVPLTACLAAAEETDRAGIEFFDADQADVAGVQGGVSHEGTLCGAPRVIRGAGEKQLLSLYYHFELPRFKSGWTCGEGPLPGRCLWVECVLRRAKRHVRPVRTTELRVASIAWPGSPDGLSQLLDGFVEFAGLLSDREKGSRLIASLDVGFAGSGGERRLAHEV